jgi:hypothetical protein
MRHEREAAAPVLRCGRSHEKGGKTTLVCSVRYDCGVCCQNEIGSWFTAHDVIVFVVMSAVAAPAATAAAGDDGSVQRALVLEIGSAWTRVGWAGACAGVGVSECCADRRADVQASDGVGCVRRLAIGSRRALRRPVPTDQCASNVW